MIERDKHLQKVINLISDLESTETIFNKMLGLGYSEVQARLMIQEANEIIKNEVQADQDLTLAIHILSRKKMISALSQNNSGSAQKMKLDIMKDLAELEGLYNRQTVINNTFENTNFELKLTVSKPENLLLDEED